MYLDLAVQISSWTKDNLLHNSTNRSKKNSLLRLATSTEPTSMMFNLSHGFSFQKREVRFKTNAHRSISISVVNRTPTHNVLLQPKVLLLALNLGGKRLLCLICRGIERLHIDVHDVGHSNNIKLQIPMNEKACERYFFPKPFTYTPHAEPWVLRYEKECMVVN